MNSWVRYSVAVYLGLLMAGAILAPQPQASQGVPPRFPVQAAHAHATGLGQVDAPPLPRISRFSQRRSDRPTLATLDLAHHPETRCD